jgi:hypothetical protein
MKATTKLLIAAALLGIALAPGTNPSAGALGSCDAKSCVGAYPTAACICPFYTHRPGELSTCGGWTLPVSQGGC